MDPPCIFQLLSLSKLHQRERYLALGIRNTCPHYPNRPVEKVQCPYTLLISEPIISLKFLHLVTFSCRFGRGAIDELN